MCLKSKIVGFLTVFCLLSSSVMAADNVCLTPGCVHAASKILAKMDETIVPCDDFYNFACGTFLKETVISDDQKRVDVNNEIDDKLQQQLRTLMDSLNDSDIKPFKLMKKLYRACMNTSNCDKQCQQKHQ